MNTKHTPGPWEMHGADLMAGAVRIAVVDRPEDEAGNRNAGLDWDEAYGNMRVISSALTVIAERDALRAEISRLRGTLSGRIAADNASLRAALHAVITAHDMTQITAPSAGVMTARIDEARRALSGGGKS